jgi:hypothetical protein
MAEMFLPLPHQSIADTYDGSNQLDEARDWLGKLLG